MKDSWRSTMIIPITLSFIVFYIYASEDVLAASTRDLCRPEQRDALLKFRNEFEIGKRNPYCEMYGIESHRTESWTSNSDCCSWKGIACNANSGEVAELDLSCSFLHGQFHSNSVLQNIHSLTTLNLSFNSLTGKIPSSIGNLSNLTSLDLSFNYFSGQIPTSFGNLFHLTYLDLSHNNFSGALPPNITSLSKLSIFKASHNTFTGAIPSSLFTIPSLTFIGLNDNQLSGTLEFGNISPPSNLQDLHIGGNIFKGPIPKSISKLVNLWTLDLSHFDTQGPVDFSIFSHLKSLQVLDLSYLNTTTTIDLYDILSYFKSLSHLDLSGNRVSTTKKSSSSNPPSKLTTLGFSGCSITEFPELLRTQHEMRLLDISSNKIKGHVPGWLWTLPKLEYVNLFNNTFTSFERSKKKQGLSSVWKPSLVHLLGSNNNFTGKIPTFICELRSLKTLDLSENNFNGLIPRCMGNLKSSLSILNLDLNLRQNNLSGGLPDNIFESLRSLDVGHNQLVGKLPRSLIRSTTLEILNVESNRLKDIFPVWLSSLQNLQVLVIRSNAFHGPIHQVLFRKLRIIDISYNHFNGTLPSDFFLKWSAMSSLGTEEDTASVNYMGSGNYYQHSLFLMNKGVRMELVRILKIFTAIDFSGNKFEGEIPKSIGVMKELHVLNLSNNAFTGRIPSSMGNLTALESLDVSQNKLSGEIPQELGKLSFLAYMNFSHNKLVGLLPGGNQFQTQNCSSFEDNLGLFGSSLDEICRDIHTQASQQKSETSESEIEDKVVISWITATIGFIPGIFFGFTIGYILVSYKPKWFMNPFG
ncbi:receptor-like protein 12 [Capsella rubella]|uniref:receptor-like protein 12 n=1 Tax=Capsella rubella TaxID=81985 RepID=UPI000CD50216|nr:receptor-like protein 12 [Capsella rubella]